MMTKNGIRLEAEDSHGNVALPANTGSYTATTLIAEIATLRAALRVCGAGRLTTDRSDLAALLRIQEIADAALGGDK